MLERIGWTDVRSRTAATLERVGADGATRAYTIFLMTGRKP